MNKLAAAALALWLVSVAAPVAAQTLSWVDPDTTLTGFHVERAPCSTTDPTSCTPFAEIATVAAGTFSYQDAGPLTAGAIYAYRIAAFNAVAISPYSNTAVYIKPLTTPTLTVTVASGGRGAGGTVASTPAGILCTAGQTCSATFAQWTTVQLTETPKQQSAFAGWSGACSGLTRGCTVQLAAPTTVTASFVRR